MVSGYFAYSLQTKPLPEPVIIALTQELSKAPFYAENQVTAGAFKIDLGLDEFLKAVSASELPPFTVSEVTSYGHSVRLHYWLLSRNGPYFHTSESFDALFPGTFIVGGVNLEGNELVVTPRINSDDPVMLCLLAVIMFALGLFIFSRGRSSVSLQG